MRNAKITVAEEEPAPRAKHKRNEQLDRVINVHFLVGKRKTDFRVGHRWYIGVWPCVRNTDSATDMSFLANPLASSTAYGAVSERKLSNMVDILGPPSNYIKSSPDDGLQHSTLTMYNLMKDRNVYLGDTFDVFDIHSHNRVLLSIVPPVESNATTYVYRRFRLNRGLAQLQAPGTNSLGVTHESQEFQKKLLRYGNSVVVNMETLDSEEGKGIAFYHIAGMYASFLDTYEQLIVEEMMRHTDAYADKLMSSNKMYPTIEDALAKRNYFWDIFRKTKRGAYEALEEAKNIMDPLVPTTVVVGSKAKSVIAFDEAEQDYYKAGARSESRVMDGAESLDRLARLDVAVLRAWPDRNTGALIAPLRRLSTIGDMAFLTYYNEHLSPSNYTSHMLSGEFFTMQTGRGHFERLSAEMGCDFSQRFIEDGDDGPLASHHAALATNASGYLESTQLSAPGGFVDMFLYHLGNNTYDVAEVFGQMEHTGLPDAAIRNVAATIRARMMERLGSTTIKAIEDGLRALNQVYTKTLTSDDIDAMVARATEAEGAGTAAGTGNVALFAGSDDFSGAVQELYDVASSLFIESHPAFSGKLTPAQFESADGIAGFTQTLIDGNKLPVLYRNDFEATVPQGTDDELAQALDGLSESARLAPTLYIRKLYEDPNAVTQQFSASTLAAQLPASAGTSLPSLIEYLGSNLNNDEETVRALSAVLQRASQGQTIQGDFLSVVRQLAKSVEVPNTAPGRNFVRTPLSVSPKALLNAYAQFPAARNFVFQSPVDPARVIEVPPVTNGTISPADRARFLKQASLADSRQDMMALGYNAVEPVFNFTSFANAAAYGRHMGQSASGTTVTSNFSQRYAMAGRERNLLLRLAMQLFLLAPIKKRQFKLWIEKDVLLPCDFLIVRPRRTYVTQSAIVVVAGDGYGNLVRMPAQMRRADDAHTGEIQLMLSVYAGAIIKDQFRQLLLPDVFVEDYVSGETWAPYTPETFDASQAKTDPTASAIYMMVPYGSLRGPYGVEKTIDITGRWREDFAESRFPQSLLEAYSSKPLYPSAAYYVSLYRLNLITTDYASWLSRFPVNNYMSAPDNTIVQRTMGYYLDPSTGQFTLHNLNTDPFGVDISEGHGELRKGQGPSHYPKTDNRRTAVRLE